MDLYYGCVPLRCGVLPDGSDGASLEEDLEVSLGPAHWGGVVS
jgi:hypothetical protein